MLNERPIKEVIKDKNGEVVDVIFNFCSVEKNTVGQYTGLTDKNGEKIFEGDIVQDKRRRFYIGFDEGSFCYTDGTYLIPLGDSEFGCALHGECDELEVIGNIHDNPELLEVR